MIELVLEQATGQLRGFDGYLVAIEATANHVHPVGPHDLPREARNRQAALLVRPLAIGLDDLGVDDGLGAAAVVEVPDEQALLHADLRRSQAEAGGRVHGLDHVVDELHEAGVDVGDVGRLLLEDGVSDHTDLVGRHEGQATVATVPSPQPKRADHYFSPDPSAPSAPQAIELILPEGRLIRLATDRGTFSPDRVDDGTRALLVEGPAVASTGVLADIGCGYGPIAIALALRGGPGVTVWAVDVNERARALCRANAEANGVGAQVRVVAPDEVPTDLVVDQFWSNPPIRIGKAALHDLLVTWLDRLAPGTGTAELVVQKHLGADSLTRWLAEQGWAAERTASRAGYRILHVAAST